MAKNTGKVREFCQSGKVGTLPRQTNPPTPEMATKAGDAHPTGMHSCM